MPATAKQVGYNYAKKRTDIHTILLIGSGPIVIGQACEFDYSGTQAAKTLKNLGYRVVLINSNPATIMTDPDFADCTYIEPITEEVIAKIIEKEKVDAILPTMGGQTALNVAMSMYEKGMLDGVQFLGAKPEAIKKGEDRQAFKEAMLKIGMDLPKSRYAYNIDEALQAASEIGFPLIIRASFTLAGGGSGVAYNIDEFKVLAQNGLDTSPVSEILIEESLLGWKEYEMEVIRDKNDNCIIVCSIENLDPMGVHTGDSITIAPALTLTDKEYQRMRDASFKILREIGVDTGGSNVQFAINPSNGRMTVIEMNPRVSRSSALASKATGYPIAKVATMLAVGFSLDEIGNDITGTPASFEPSIDYIVTKIPRFTFEKFPQADSTLTTSMKSIGEVMAIGGTFKESLQKALCSLEIGLFGFNRISTDIELVKKEIRRPNASRLLYIAEGFGLGMSVDYIHELCKIDKWFLSQIQDIVLMENAITSEILSNKALMRKVKSYGFSDKMIAFWLKENENIELSESEVYQARLSLGITHSYHEVDTCSGEFPSLTPYLYSSIGNFEPLEFDCVKEDESEMSLQNLDSVKFLHSETKSNNLTNDTLKDSSYSFRMTDSSGLSPQNDVNTSHNDAKNQADMESKSSQSQPTQEEREKDSSSAVFGLQDTRGEHSTPPISQKSGGFFGVRGSGVGEQPFFAPKEENLKQGENKEIERDSEDSSHSFRMTDSSGLSPQNNENVYRNDINSQNDIKSQDATSVMLSSSETSLRNLDSKNTLKDSSASLANDVNASCNDTENQPHTESKTPQEKIQSTPQKKVLIIGGGPNRIGQGIEFDYCCVHASFALKDMGIQSIMYNCNPETVSTDYDTSDILYFEPIDFEHVRSVIERENPDGIIVHFGGQTPLKLSNSLSKINAKIIGTSARVIDIAEDREKFAKFLTNLGLNQPKNGIAFVKEQAYSIANEIGFPVLVRPSYVLGGRAMRIVYDNDELKMYMDEVIAISESAPILIDKFLEHAIEFDIDCISDGSNVYIGGILEHIEEAGIHSGDSASSLPPFSVSDEMIEHIESTTARIAISLGVVGLMNVQYAIYQGELYLIEVNPRASRTVPFVSKAVGIPLAKVATRVMWHVSYGMDFGYESDSIKTDSNTPPPNLLPQGEGITLQKDSSHAFRMTVSSVSLANDTNTTRNDDTQKDSSLNAQNDENDSCNDINVSHNDVNSHNDTDRFHSDINSHNEVKSQNNHKNKNHHSKQADNILEEALRFYDSFHVLDYNAREIVVDSRICRIYSNPKNDYCSIKESVFPFHKLPGADLLLGPEMKSTGEVMGIAKSFGIAFAKSQVACKNPLPKSGNIFISLRNSDKKYAIDLARSLREMGFEIIATLGTHKILLESNIDASAVLKVSEGRPHIIDMITNKQIDMVINTTTNKDKADARLIRQAVLRADIPYFTTINGAMSAINAMREICGNAGEYPKSLQEYIKRES